MCGQLRQRKLEIDPKRESAAASSSTVDVEQLTERLLHLLSDEFCRHRMERTGVRAGALGLHLPAVL
jgi:hypothetical protein